MDELLAALERDPGRAWRRWLVAARGEPKDAVRARLIGLAARDDYATCAGHEHEHATVVAWLDGLDPRR